MWHPPDRTRSLGSSQCFSKEELLQVNPPAPIPRCAYLWRILLERAFSRMTRTANVLRDASSWEDRWRAAWTASRHHREETTPETLLWAFTVLTLHEFAAQLPKNGNTSDNAGKSMIAELYLRQVLVSLDPPSLRVC